MIERTQLPRVVFLGAGSGGLQAARSLSRAPPADDYQVSVKQAANGAASTYVHQQVRVGDVLDVSAPRGAFTYRPGNHSIVLLSAGVGATPVLAILHALAAKTSSRDVWWLYGARNREQHPCVLPQP